MQGQYLSFTHMALSMIAMTVANAQLPPCPKELISYALTECDESNGRWRVSVPVNSSTACTVPPSASPPLRIRNCDETCASGNFYDLENLRCTQCPSGTYSAGSVQTYSDWAVVPPDFTSNSIPLKLQLPFGSKTSQSACARQTWTARDDYIELEEGQGCLTKLSLEVNLVQPGSVTFEYQYPESSMMLLFSSIPAECRAELASGHNPTRFLPDRTNRGEWSTVKLDLLKGKQTLVWTGLGSLDSERTFRPIRIRRIEVFGVKYSSSCTPCPSGTYSNAGSSRCNDCPVNTYSGKGFGVCTPCSADSYALPGFSQCLKRPVCTAEDYQQLLGDCDVNGQAKVVYDWLQPKICASDQPNAAQLPSASIMPCPRCPSGMYRYNSTICNVCDNGKFVNSVGKCQQCDPGLSANYEYNIDVWSYIPYGVDVFCWSPSAMGCSVNNSGWQLKGDHVASGYGHEDDAVMVLQLFTSGFRKMLETDNYGHAMFEFETSCKNPKCQLDFLLEDTETYGTIKVRSFTGNQPRQRFDYTIPRNGSFALTWIFVKMDQQNNPTAQTKQRLFAHDVVKIYSIKLTNTIDGGATSCQPCAGNGKDCLHCREDEIWDSNSKQCQKCLNNSMPNEERKCVPCNENLIAVGGKCVASCTATINGKTIDLTPLKGIHQAHTQHFFQATGEDYNHVYNISLCAEEQATCRNTEHKFGQSQKVAIGTVCRSTILKAAESSNDTTSLQSFVTGEQVAAITDKTYINGVKPEDFSERQPEFPATLAPDFFMYIRAPTPTASCSTGRSTVIRFRCSKNATSRHDIYFPTNCAEGTCDGCNYHMLWQTEFACPVCGPDDYTIVRGECAGGVQNVFYHPKPFCRETNSSTSLVKKAECHSVPYSVQMLILALVVSGFALVLLVVYLYKSVKRYEYKYMKLIHDSSGVVQLQLPESCLEENEGGEDLDGQDGSADGNGNVQFVTPSETVFKKVKKAVTKRNDMRHSRVISTNKTRDDEENHLLDS